MTKIIKLFDSTNVPCSICGKTSTDKQQLFIFKDEENIKTFNICKKCIKLPKIEVEIDLLNINIKS